MKKILAFTLALAMVLSTATMTFAASKEVEALANLKLLLNTTDAEVNADLNRAVGLAMVLKALGYTQEDANAKAEANTFVDMEKYGWAKGFTVLGEELKITNGTSVEPKMFSPSAKLNERAFVAFMLRALGYDVDAAWAKAGEIAKEAGVAETVTENKLTKGEAAVIMYKALMAKVQGDEKGRTLAQKLVDEKKLDKDLAVANGLISGEPEKLTVTAMADNLVEVKVMFDGTVDQETAKNKANYKVKGATVKEAKVLEDGKTVVVRLASGLANKREHELTVAGVKNVAGVVMDKQTVKFSTNDVTAPTVEKITVTGPKSFEITFSEPMKEEGKVFVTYGKNGKLSVKNFKPNGESFKDGGRVLDVQMNNSFQEGKEYTIMIGDGKNNKDYPKDYATYTTAYYEEVVTYAKDTAAPEVKVVKADQKEVTLEFTKPVKGLTDKHFSHTFSFYHPVEFKVEDSENGETDIKGKSLTKVTLVFRKGTSGNALPAGEVKLMVVGKAGSDKIQDNWGNQLADTELTVSISADREAPEVVSVEVTAKDKVKVTFNEDIKSDDLKKDITVQLLDKDGKAVETNSTTGMTYDAKKKALELDFKKEYVGKTMTLVLKGVKDASLYNNMMADYTTEVSFEDKELKFSDKIKAEYQKKTEGYFLYVTFEEEMDDSALEAKNYRLKNGAAEQELQGTGSFLDGNRKVVAFELTTSETSTDKTDVWFLTGSQTGDGEHMGSTESQYSAVQRDLVISNRVKDLAGNVNAEFQFVKRISQLNSGAFTIAAGKMVAVDVNKIEVEFNAPIVEFNDNPNVWEFKKHNGTDVDDKRAILSVEPKADSDKVVVLTLDTENKSALSSNPALETAKIHLTLKENNGFVDSFGRPAKSATHVLVDKIAPAFSKIKKSSDSGVQDTAEYAFTNLKTNQDKYADKPAIMAKDQLTADGNDHKTFTVQIKYTEKVDADTLANTTYTFNKDVTVKGRPAVDNAVDTIVNITVRVSKDLDAATINAWEDFTISQVGNVKDVNGNTMKTVNDVQIVLFNVTD